jgi:hypothetical protein
MEAFIIIWLICAAIGAAIGNQKGMAVQGAILGLVLGLIGVLIIAIIPAKNPATASPMFVVNQGTPLSPQPNMGGAGLADSLRELDSLHTEGLLTDDEFRAQKRVLLGFGDGDLPARTATANASNAASNIASAPPVAPIATPPSPAGAMPGHHFCEDCGTRLADAVKFCSNCGGAQG